MADLDDDDVGVQVGQPAGPQVAGDRLGGAGVDEHDELVDLAGGRADEVAVPEVRRAEPSDDEPGGHGSTGTERRISRATTAGSVRSARW